MIHYKKEYDTPYGVYTIVSYGPYKPGERIDNTPISPDSIANEGGYDILADGSFIVKCETLKDAQETLGDLLKYAHRYILKF